MITVEQIAQIRHAYYNEGRSVRWIAPEYHHSREKVRQALDNPEPRRYTRTKAKPAPVMDPWKPRIDTLLIESDGLPRKHRYTAKRIYDLLYADGYRGCVGGVSNYVAQKRGTRQQRARVEVHLPLEFEPGRDAQADWGEALVELNGVQRTVQVFALRLCYSRVTFLCAYPTQRQECLFDGHVRAFAFFGGLPHKISYDNLTTAVQAILAGKGRREQQAFTQFRSYYLFESRFCTPGEGHEKGQIEHAVGYGRRNFMTPLLKADSFEGLNAQLQLACQNDLQRTVDGQTGTFRLRALAARARAATPLAGAALRLLRHHPGDANALQSGDLRHQPLLGARGSGAARPDGARLSIHGRGQRRREWAGVGHPCALLRAGSRRL
jgi:transposase